MDDQKKIIKDDINFLEMPNWVVDRKSKATKFIIEKPHGRYEMISPIGLPKHFDKIVLYSLLYKLHRESKPDSYILTTNRYEIAKNVFPFEKDFGKNRYKRIMDSLKKWNAISIHFDGLFYSGEERSIRYFHIIDEVTLDIKSGKLTIKLNASYVRQLKETTFYKLINFEQYRKLHKTVSARLYEILVKNFCSRDEWAINIQLLAEKLTFEKRDGAQKYYPSDVLRYLKPSINEISRKTDLAIQLDYNHETAVCIFKRVKKAKATYVAAKRSPELDKQKVKNDDHVKQVAKNMDIFKNLPADVQQKILDDIKRDSFLPFIKDQAAQIYAYMSRSKKANKLT